MPAFADYWSMLDLSVQKQSVGSMQFNCDKLKKKEKKIQ